MNVEFEQPIVQKSESVTSSERCLRRFCDRSFLTLWSYPGIHRDQGKCGKGDGKEVCDLLVVFEDHIIIFSDKECEFPSANIEISWQRWYRRAIQKSAHQVWGAERWLRDHPTRLFLDKKCTQPFPLELPPTDKAKIHRVVVAHGAARACRESLGGSGSLMIDPNIIGRNHTQPVSEGGKPFAIGQIDPSRGFVHVLDDTSLAIVLGTLDTISDFVSYLIKREQFLRSGRLGWAAGEEELLAYYLKKINDEGQHDFVVPSQIESISIFEGIWEQFVRHPQRQAQLRANRISYAWDALIENFAKHILGGTSHFNSHVAIAERERIFRFLAREGRTRRRLLAEALLGILKETPAGSPGARIVLPSYPGDPHYVFLLLPKQTTISPEQYRVLRRDLLQAYCMVTKLKCPEAQAVVGIATESGQDELRSEDALYLDTSDWTKESEELARQLQQDLGILIEVREFRSIEKEYPEWRLAPQKPNRKARRASAARLRRQNKRKAADTKDGSNSLRSFDS